jgi:TIR domain
MTGDESFELDFYICADRNSPAVQEIKKILREAGYSVYLPIRTEVEPELDRIAEERFRTIALVLTSDREQARIDLEELLIILSIRDDAPEVIIFQFERNELAALIDTKFIVDLVGLYNSKDRKACVLASFERDAPSLDTFEELYSETKSPQTAHDLHPNDLSTVGSAQRSQKTQASPKKLVDPLEAACATPSAADPQLDMPPDSPQTVCAQGPNFEEIVEFGVSHPTSVAIGISFIIDVLIYCQHDRSQALERAAELRPESYRFSSAGAALFARGTKLSISLRLPWDTEPKSQIVYWSGAITNVSFRVLPTHLMPTPVYGTCNVAVGGLTIGQVFFRLESGSDDQRTFSRAQVIKSAFASYTSKDRRQVLDRVQGIEKLGVSVFMDTHGLRSNDQYKKRIFEAIDSADIFYLFWSRHAARSNWVDQEWRYGYKQKGLAFIDPVPLVDPRKVPPPPELAEHRHINDWTLIYSEYEKSIGRWARVRSWLAGFAV